MGRNKKYFTNEQRREAKQRENRQYYSRNKERINKERMRKYYEKMNEISGQPGARDPSGLPYNPRSVAREVMGVGVGKPWPLTVSGKTYMIPVKSWSAPGVPVFDGKDLPPELNFGENK